MLKIALITNFNIPEKANAANAVADKLKGKDCRILVAAFNKEKLMRVGKHREEFVYMPLEAVYSEADIIIVLGGDGTILEVARRAATRGTPILGINLGRLGYMAELEMSGLDGLDALFTGDYTLDRRSMLRVELLSGNELRSFCYALNDAVISNGSVSRIVDLELLQGGKHVANYRADGLIIATPTGSTAYSMSAGGAVVDPAVPCFCVTPICPHMMNARPILFPDDVVLEVKNICKREKALYLTLDGRNNYELFKGDVVRISKSDLYASIVQVKDRNFYEKMRSKLR